MTVVVTRDVAQRFRGFLASCMLEIGPGIYTAPRMTQGVRERVWTVLEEWFNEVSGGSVLMTWRDPSVPGGQRIAVLGALPCELHRHNGVYLARKRGVKTPTVAADQQSGEDSSSDND